MLVSQLEMSCFKLLLLCKNSHGDPIIKSKTILLEANVHVLLVLILSNIVIGMALPFNLYFLQFDYELWFFLFST